jgi:hypothetical protein
MKPFLPYSPDEFGARALSAQERRIMGTFSFNDRDLKQIKEMGLTPEKVLLQIESFKRGFPYAKLNRPCTVGDGMHLLSRPDLNRYAQRYSEVARSGRAMKFVPASGAASRMFKAFLAVNSRYERITDKEISREMDSDHRAVQEFVRGLRKFALFEDLRSAMARNNLDMEALLEKGEYKPILEYLLTPKGLDLANVPKGLIKFHSYPGHSRTAFEEHLVEGAAYTQDRNGGVRIHFTVSPEHETPVQSHIESTRALYEKGGVTFNVEFSSQKASTDTIAVDMDNKPFRDRDGPLVFRPGGHGSLLENLCDLSGDILFIKNIDNVLPDRLKEETIAYKKALGGLLIDLQKKIFTYVDKLMSGEGDQRLLTEMMGFMKDHLFIMLPDRLGRQSRDEQVRFLVSRLNRPLRVCGMVKNEGEPGGGPFWVEHPDGTCSLQIVESSQVDMGSSQQKKILGSSTHFNPVDLVCGIRDYKGKPFDLRRFVDPETGFISVKSKDGKDLKALEHPGLWNGAMADWTTVFVEVPLATFSPVKTLLDLLRKEHQS